MGNPFVHLELNTPDLGKATSFYGEMFGWELKDNDMGEMGTYTTFKPSEGPGGGMMSFPGPHAWTPYIGVEDIDAATEKAKSLGATMIVEAKEIPHVGWFSLMQDPTGCAIAIFEPLPTHASPM